MRLPTIKTLLVCVALLFPLNAYSFTCADLYEDWEKKVEKFKPDLIALSATEDLWLPGIALLKRIRHKKILTLAGGVFCTFAPDLAISYNEIDIVCKGEGEIALVELCNKIAENKNYDNIKNLWIKKNDKIIKNGLNQVEMNDNPLIDLSIFVCVLSL